MTQPIPMPIAIATAPTSAPRPIPIAPPHDANCQVPPVAASSPGRCARAISRIPNTLANGKNIPPRSPRATARSTVAVVSAVPIKIAW